MTVTAEERRYLLQQVNRLAETDLKNLWSHAADLSNVEFSTFVTQAYPALTDPYISMAGRMAATWFELSDPASTYVAVEAALPPVEKLQKTARWALKATGEQGRTDLAGSLNRAVFDGARDTTRINVERTNSRWAVDARPTACPWCRMMATRGALYKEQATALAACHDHGHCVAVEIRTPNNYQAPAHVEQWQSEYLKARADAGTGSPKDIQAAWRQLIKTS